MGSVHCYKCAYYYFKIWSNSYLLVGYVSWEAGYVFLFLLFLFLSKSRTIFAVVSHQCRSVSDMLFAVNLIVMILLNNKLCKEEYLDIASFLVILEIWTVCPLHTHYQLTQLKGMFQFFLSWLGYCLSKPP